MNGASVPWDFTAAVPASSAEVPSTKNTMDWLPGVLGMQTPAGTVARKAAPLGGTVEPENLWPNTHFVSKTASDLNAVNKFCMSVAGKLNQDGFTEKLGPGRDRWQSEALQGGCFT